MRIFNICNLEIPYSFIFTHKRTVHHLGKPIDDVTPRVPNFKLRLMLIQGENLDKLTEETEFEDVPLAEADFVDSKTLHHGENTYIFSFI